MCVKKFFNGCNCVPDDLSYHSPLKGACYVFLLKSFFALQNHQPMFFSPIEKYLYLLFNLQNHAPHFLWQVVAMYAWRNFSLSKFHILTTKKGSFKIQNSYFGVFTFPQNISMCRGLRVFPKENTKLIHAYHPRSPIFLKNFLITIFNSPNVIFNNAQKSFFFSQSLTRINFSFSIGKFLFKKIKLLNQINE